MAGLCAAAEARSRGADVLLVEKATAPGGSMLLSSGVVWRHVGMLGDPRHQATKNPPSAERVFAHTPN